MKILFFLLFISIVIPIDFLYANDNKSTDNMTILSVGEYVFNDTKIYTERDNVGNESTFLGFAPNEYFFTLQTSSKKPIKYIITFNGIDARYFSLADIVTDNGSLADNSCVSNNMMNQKEFIKGDTCKIRVTFGGHNDISPTAGMKHASMIVTYDGNKEAVLEFKFTANVIRVADIYYLQQDNYTEPTVVNMFDDTIVGKQSSKPYIWINSNNIDLKNELTPTNNSDMDNVSDDRHSFVLQFGKDFKKSFKIAEDKSTCKIDDETNILTLDKEPCYLFIYFNPTTTGKVSSEFKVIAIDSVTKEERIILSEILAGTGIKK